MITPGGVPQLDVDDPHQKKTDDLLSQIGLHPAQIKAQLHLMQLGNQMGNQHPLDIAAAAAGGGDQRTGQVNLPNEGQVTGADIPSSSPPPINVGKPAPWSVNYKTPADIPTPAAPARPSAQPPSNLPAPTAPAAPAAPPPLIDTTAAKAQAQPLADVPIKMPAPTVTSPGMIPNLQEQNTNQQILDAQKEYQRLKTTGSGISQIKNPFLRGLARTGDIAAAVMFPGQEPLIPGGEGRHTGLLNRQLSLIKEGEEAQGKEATAEEAKARTQAALHPKGEFREATAVTGPEGQPALYNTQTGQWEAAPPGYKLNPRALPGGEGEIPLGHGRVMQLNKLMENRYHVLNPGQPMPPEYVLPENATQKDFDRLDKVLQQTEMASGTAEQRKQTEALRTETQQLAKEAQQTREQNVQSEIEKRDATPSVGFIGNKMVYGSAGDLRKNKVTDIRTATAQETNQTESARHGLELMDNNDPNDLGAQQALSQMTKEDWAKFGSFGTRMEDFLTAYLGEGATPAFNQFRTQIGLLNTLLGSIHIGRVSKPLIEHFEDLINSRRMSPQTLKVILDTAERYMKDRAMVPSWESGEAPKGPASGHTLSKADIQKIATAHKMSYDDAAKDFKSKGGTISDEGGTQ